MKHAEFHIYSSLTLMRMEQLSKSFMAFLTIESLKYNIFKDNNAFHGILDGIK